MKTTYLSCRVDLAVLKNCSNFSCGICTGAFFQVDHDSGEIKTFINLEFAGKPCKVAVGEKCLFFDSVVIPSIPPGQSRGLAALQIKADRQRTTRQKMMKSKFQKNNSIQSQISFLE